MDDIIEIARTMRERSCARTLAGTCKEILGTCQSVGCTVDHEDPQEITRKVTRSLCDSMMCIVGTVQISEGEITIPDE